MPTDTNEFTAVWTDRTVNEARGNSLMLNFGNRRSEATLQANETYYIRVNEFDVQQETRQRGSSGTGALGDLTEASVDAGSVEWFGIQLVNSRVFKARADQRDLPRMRGVDIAAIRNEMVRDIATWTDQQIIGQYIAGTIGVDNQGASITAVPPTTVELPDQSDAVSINRNTHRLVGGNQNNRDAWADALIDWLEQAILDMGAEDWTGPQADGTTLTPACVMPASFLYAIEQRIIARGRDVSESLMLQGFDRPPNVFSAAWRGRYRGQIDIFVTNRRQSASGQANGFVPVANTGAGGAARNLYRAFLFVPQNTFDSALITYPAQTTPPSGTSAKWWLQQELEVGYGTVNGDNRGFYRQVTARASS